MLQNMKGSQLLAVTAIAGLALMGSTFKAQNAPTKVGLVDVDAVFASHPKYKDLTEIGDKANAEMEQLRTTLKINDLAAKAQAANASAKDKQDFETAKKTYDAAGAKWQKQITALQEPVDTDVNRAIANVAKAQGFSVILNRGSAAKSGLVIYADEQATNLTADVMKALK
jgi:outer membrane protein